MPSTFVHGLLPPTCLAFSKKVLPPLSRTEWLKFLFSALVLANAPDLDIIPAAIFPSHWQEIHRNWGHNVFSLSLWISLGAWALPLWVSQKLQQSRWKLASLLVLSHIFLDSMQDYDHFGVVRGVPLLWPFSTVEFSLPFRLFHVLDLDQSQHFLIAHILSYEFWHRAFLHEITNSLVLLGIWLVVFNGGYWLYQGITRRKTPRRRSPTTFNALKKETSEGASLEIPCAPRLNPEPPSPLHQDVPPNRISAGS